MERNVVALTSMKTISSDRRLYDIIMQANPCELFDNEKVLRNIIKATEAENESENVNNPINKSNVIITQKKGLSRWI